jgi:hypothetical protein
MAAYSKAIAQALAQSDPVTAALEPMIDQVFETDRRAP